MNIFAVPLEQAAGLIFNDANDGLSSKVCLLLGTSRSLPRFNAAVHPNI